MMNFITVSSNAQQLRNISNVIDKNIQDMCCSSKCYSKHKYEFKDLEQAISCLKQHRVSSDGDYYSNHILYGSDKLKLYLMFSI